MPSSLSQDPRSTPEFVDPRGLRIIMLVIYLVAIAGLVLGTAAMAAATDQRGFQLGLRAAVVLWGTQLALAPGVFWFARRFPLEPRVWKRNLCIHLCSSLLFLTACEIFSATAARWVTSEQFEREHLWEGRPGLRGLFRRPGPPPHRDPHNPHDHHEHPPRGPGRPMGIPNDWGQRPHGAPPGRGEPPHEHARHSWLPAWLLARAQVSLPMYWVAVSLAHVFGYASRLQNREQRTARLEAEMTQARLLALQSQLQPHFLFNTLNSISALIATDPRGADEMLGNLADLLRLTLDQRNRSEISLAEELRVLQCYADIQKIRFQDRLDLSIDVSTDCLDALVPALVLQPLVENAIEHGAVGLGSQGRIHIRGFRDPQRDRLILRVSDNGPGIPDEKLAGLKEGVGLSNVKTRLRTLYAQNYAFTLHTHPSEGFSATLDLPFHTVHPAPDPSELKPIP